MLRSRLLFLVVGSFALAGCVAIAGVSDFAVDPCFDGCIDSPIGIEGSVPEGSPGEDAPFPMQDASDAGADTATDAEVDADAQPPPSPGKSVVTVSGTGVAVGKVAIVTLTAKDDLGVAVARTGSTVVFKTSGGTSVVTFGTVLDKGDGTYRATVTGVTEGTKLNVSATLDGAPLTTTPASLRVVNPVATGLTFSIDAANADRANNFGGKNCAAAGLTQWTDLTASSFPGALTGFADPCGAASGWGGAGAPEDPFRLTFDGIDDHVDFGAVNDLQKYTVLAWIRKTGTGTTGTSGNGGLVNVTPFLTKGTAQSEVATIDINYFLGIAATGELAGDYEGPPSGMPANSPNAPLTGNTVLVDDTWYMVGMTLDAAGPTRNLWLNGVVDGTLAPVNPPSSATSSLLIVGGAKTTTAPGASCAGITGCGRFKGDIAVVMTYSRALTTAEIEKNCHSFSSRFGISTCPN